MDTTKGPCVKMHAARSADGLTAGVHAVEWCHTHQRLWSDCADKRTIADLGEALREARRHIVNTYSDTIDHEPLIARIDAALKKGGA